MTELLRVMQIIDQYSNVIPEGEYLEACNWCNGRDYNVAQVDAAIQTKKPLEFKKIV